MRPDVSVIMSVYNGAAFVGPAVESILTQTFADFEFIIIDDGSTDDSVERIARYNDTRIRLLRNQSNIGLTRSLNRALKVASGQYIARQDVDDVSEPHRLAQQRAFLESHPDHVVVGSHYVQIDEQGATIAQSQPPVAYEDILVWLVAGNALGHGTVMFRSEPDLQYDATLPYAQDYDLWTRFIRIGKVVNLPEFLYRCRKHAARISTVFREEQDSCARVVARRHVDYLAQHGKYDILCRAYLEWRNETALAPLIRKILMQVPATVLRHEIACGRSLDSLKGLPMYGREALEEFALVRRCFGTSRSLRWLVGVLATRGAHRAHARIGGLSPGLR